MKASEMLGQVVLPGKAMTSFPFTLVLRAVNICDFVL